MYPILFGYLDVDASKFYDVIGPSRTLRNHNFKLSPQPFPTNYFLVVFFNRFVGDWNSLPSNVICGSSPNSFMSLSFKIFAFKVILLAIPSTYYIFINSILLLLLFYFLCYLVNRFILLSL